MTMTVGHSRPEEYALTNREKDDTTAQGNNIVNYQAAINVAATTHNTTTATTNNNVSKDDKGRSGENQEQTTKLPQGNPSSSFSDDATAVHTTSSKVDTFAVSSSSSSAASALNSSSINISNAATTTEVRSSDETNNSNNNGDVDAMMVDDEEFYHFQLMQYKIHSQEHAGLCLGIHLGNIDDKACKNSRKPYPIVTKIDVKSQGESLGVQVGSYVKSINGICFRQQQNKNQITTSSSSSSSTVKELLLQAKNSLSNDNILIAYTPYVKKPNSNDVINLSSSLIALITKRVEQQQTNNGDDSSNVNNGSGSNKDNMKDLFMNEHRGNLQCYEFIRQYLQIEEERQQKAEEKRNSRGSNTIENNNTKNNNIDDKETLSAIRIAEKVIEKIRTMDPPGRFLREVYEKNDENSTKSSREKKYYCDIGNDNATNEIRTFLKEAQKRCGTVATADSSSKELKNSPPPEEMDIDNKKIKEGTGQPVVSTKAADGSSSRKKIGGTNQVQKPEQSDTITGTTATSPRKTGDEKDVESRVYSAWPENDQWYWGIIKNKVLKGDKYTYSVKFDDCDYLSGLEEDQVWTVNGYKKLFDKEPPPLPQWAVDERKSASADYSSVEEKNKATESIKDITLPGEKLEDIDDRPKKRPREGGHNEAINGNFSNISPSLHHRGNKYYRIRSDAEKKRIVENFLSGPYRSVGEFADANNKGKMRNDANYLVECSLNRWVKKYKQGLYRDADKGSGLYSNDRKDNARIRAVPKSPEFRASVMEEYKKGNYATPTDFLEARNKGKSLDDIDYISITTFRTWLRRYGGGEKDDGSSSGRSLTFKDEIEENNKESFGIENPRRRTNEMKMKIVQEFYESPFDNAKDFANARNEGKACDDFDYLNPSTLEYWLKKPSPLASGDNKPGASVPKRKSFGVGNPRRRTDEEKLAIVAEYKASPYDSVGDFAKARNEGLSRSDYNFLVESSLRNWLESFGGKKYQNKKVSISEERKVSSNGKVIRPEEEKMRLVKEFFESPYNSVQDFIAVRNNGKATTDSDYIVYRSFRRWYNMYKCRFESNPNASEHLRSSMTDNGDTDLDDQFEKRRLAAITFRDNNVSPGRTTVRGDGKNYRFRSEEEKMAIVEEFFDSPYESISTFCSAKNSGKTRSDYEFINENSLRNWIKKEESGGERPKKLIKTSNMSVRSTGAVIRPPEFRKMVLQEYKRSSYVGASEFIDAWNTGKTPDDPNYVKRGTFQWWVRNYDSDGDDLSVSVHSSYSTLSEPISLATRKSSRFQALMTLKELHVKRCQKCVLCTRPDCMRCAACLRNQEFEKKDTAVQEQAPEESTSKPQMGNTGADEMGGKVKKSREGMGEHSAKDSSDAKSEKIPEEAKEKLENTTKVALEDTRKIVAGDLVAGNEEVNMNGNGKEGDGIERMVMDKTVDASKVEGNKEKTEKGGGELGKESIDNQNAVSSMKGKLVAAENETKGQVGASIENSSGLVAVESKNESGEETTECKVGGSKTEDVAENDKQNMPKEIGAQPVKKEVKPLGENGIAASIDQNEEGVRAENEKNKKGAKHEREVCLRKMCCAIELNDKAQPAVGFAPGWRFVFEIPKTSQSGVYPNSGDLDGLLLLAPSGRRYRSIEAACSHHPKQLSDVTKVKNRFLAYVGVDTYKQDMHDLLVGKGIRQEWTDVDGNQKVIYGVIRECDRDPRDENNVQFIVDYDEDSRLFANAVKNCCGSTVPETRKVKFELAWGGCLMFDERSNGTANGYSVFHNTVKSVNYWTWINPEMRREELIDMGNGVTLPTLTLVVRGYKLTFTPKTSSIPNAGYGVFVKISKFAADAKGSSNFELKRGELIDLGVYAPFRKEDRRSERVFFAKNFVHSYMCEEWSFDTDNVDYMFDISDDCTGDAHYLARKHIPSYVNECKTTEVPTVHAEHDPEGNVHYLFGVVDPHIEKLSLPTTGDAVEREIFINYGPLYEPVRLRKGYSELPEATKLARLKELENDDHEYLTEIENFSAEEAVAVADYLCQLITLDDAKREQGETNNDELLALECRQRVLLVLQLLEERGKVLLVANEEAGTTNEEADEEIKHILLAVGSVAYGLEQQIGPVTRPPPPKIVWSSEEKAEESTNGMKHILFSSNASFTDNLSATSGRSQPVSSSTAKTANYKDSNGFSPGDNDVVFVFGGRRCQNAGSSKYYNLINEKFAELPRRPVASSIVGAIRSQCPPGKFFQYNKTTDIWDEVIDDQVVQRIIKSLEKRNSQERKSASALDKSPVQVGEIKTVQSSSVAEPIVKMVARKSCSISKLSSDAAGKTAQYEVGQSHSRAVLPANVYAEPPPTKDAPGPMQTAESSSDIENSKSVLKPSDAKPKVKLVARKSCSVSNSLSDLVKESTEIDERTDPSIEKPESATCIQSLHISEEYSGVTLDKSAVGLSSKAVDDRSAQISNDAVPNTSVLEPSQKDKELSSVDGHDKSTTKTPTTQPTQKDDKCSVRLSSKAVDDHSAQISNDAVPSTSALEPSRKDKELSSVDGLDKSTTKTTSTQPSTVGLSSKAVGDHSAQISNGAILNTSALEPSQKEKELSSVDGHGKSTTKKAAATQKDEISTSVDDASQKPQVESAASSEPSPVVGCHESVAETATIDPTQKDARSSSAVAAAKRHTEASVPPNALLKLQSDKLHPSSSAARTVPPPQSATVSFTRDGASHQSLGNSMTHCLSGQGPSAVYGSTQQQSYYGGTTTQSHNFGSIRPYSYPYASHINNPVAAPPVLPPPSTQMMAGTQYPAVQGAAQQYSMAQHQLNNGHYGGNQRHSNGENPLSQSGGVFSSNNGREPENQAYNNVSYNGQYRTHNKSS